MKTILIIMGRYLPGYKDGGPVRSIKNLTDRLGNEYNFKILTTDRDHGDVSAYPGVKVNEWNKTGNAYVYYVNPNGFTKEIIIKLASEADMVYLCGCFNDYARTTLALKRRNQITGKVVIASMGLFSPGAFQIKKWKKSIYMLILKAAGYFKNVEWSATSQEEVKQIKNIVGNGAVCHIAQDLPRQVESKLNLTEKKQGELKVIFLSRISRKKNLSFAIDRLQNVKGKITFDIYGTMEDDEYWKECETKLKKLPDNISWNYKGEADSDNVIDIFSNYHVFLFPTLGENYGHVIFEALAGGCIPVISDQTPWDFQKTPVAGKSLPLKQTEKWTKELQQFANMSQEELCDQSKQAIQYAINESERDNAGDYRKIFNSSN